MRFFLCGPDEGGRWGLDTKRPAGAFALAGRMAD